jgi:hypothetical protein
MSKSEMIKKISYYDSDEYIENIMKKQLNNLFFCKKTEKPENDDVPHFKDYNLILKYNYNAQQLKKFAKYYKLKITGNKSQLINRICRHLFLSFYVLNIQKLGRGYLQRKYNKTHGPAFIIRSLCTNTCDFFTMDKMKDIPFEQFFSYKDDDGFIYGFDVVSLHNLIYKCDGVVKNPYNRIPISQKVIETLKQLFKLSKILRIPFSIEINNIDLIVSNEKTVELRALSLFQYIDSLGNYSDSSWFMTLDRVKLVRFVRELIDIWLYRAQLSIEVKKLICPPLGDPFYRMESFTQLQNYENINDIRKNILTILEKMVFSGVDAQYKCLGSYYVLAGLTLVNKDAADAIPWLYQSVIYNI